MTTFETNSGNTAGSRSQLESGDPRLLPHMPLFHENQALNALLMAVNHDGNNTSLITEFAQRKGGPIPRSLQGELAIVNLYRQQALQRSKVTQGIQLLNDQLHHLDDKMRRDIHVLEELQEYLKARSKMEEEHAANMARLAYSFEQKAKLDTPIFREGSDAILMQDLYRQLLRSDYKGAQAKAEDADQIARLAGGQIDIKIDSQKNTHKSSMRLLTSLQDELVTLDGNVMKAKKMYDTAAKAVLAYQKKKANKKKDNYASKLRGLESKANALRNEYLLELASANAHYRLFRDQQLPEIFDTMKSIDIDWMKAFLKSVLETDAHAHKDILKRNTKLTQRAGLLSVEYERRVFMASNQRNFPGRQMFVMVPVSPEDTTSLDVSEKSAAVLAQMRNLLHHSMTTIQKDIQGKEQQILSLIELYQHYTKAGTVLSKGQNQAKQMREKIALVFKSIEELSHEASHLKAKIRFITESGVDNTSDPSSASQPKRGPSSTSAIADKLKDQGSLSTSTTSHARMTSLSSSLSASSSLPVSTIDIAEAQEREAERRRLDALGGKKKPSSAQRAPNTEEKQTKRSPFRFRKNKHKNTPAIVVKRPTKASNADNASSDDDGEDDVFSPPPPPPLPSSVNVAAIGRGVSERDIIMSDGESEADDSAEMVTETEDPFVGNNSEHPVPHRLSRQASNVSSTGTGEYITIENADTGNSHAHGDDEGDAACRDEEIKDDTMSFLEALSSLQNEKFLPEASDRGSQPTPSQAPPPPKYTDKSAQLIKEPSHAHASDHSSYSTDADDGEDSDFESNQNVLTESPLLKRIQQRNAYLASRHSMNAEEHDQLYENVATVLSRAKLSRQKSKASKRNGNNSVGDGDDDVLMTSQPSYPELTSGPDDSAPSSPVPTPVARNLHRQRSQSPQQRKVDLKPLATTRTKRRDNNESSKRKPQQQAPLQARPAATPSSPKPKPRVKPKRPSHAIDPSSPKPLAEVPSKLVEQAPSSAMHTDDGQRKESVARLSIDLPPPPPNMIAEELGDDDMHGDDFMALPPPPPLQDDAEACESGQQNTTKEAEADPSLPPPPARLSVGGDDDADASGEETDNDEQDVDVLPPKIASIPLYSALYDYEANAHDDLAVTENELLYILLHRDDGWSLGLTTSGSVGFVPTTYIQKAKDTDDMPTTPARLLYLPSQCIGSFSVSGGCPVVVRGVDHGSLAYRAGLRNSDMFIEINATPCASKSSAAVRKALSSCTKAHVAVCVINRRELVQNAQELQ